MIHELRLRKVGNAVGLIVPPAVLDHLDAGIGDHLAVTLCPDGTLRLSPETPEVAAQMDRVRDLFLRYPRTLRGLAL